jgi:hypothetical protein
MRSGRVDEGAAALHESVVLEPPKQNDLGVIRQAFIRCPDPAAPKPVVTTSAQGASGDAPVAVPRAEQLSAAARADAAQGCQLQMQ